jgi:hypothetical protein
MAAPPYSNAAYTPLCTSGSPVFPSPVVRGKIEQTNRTASRLLPLALAFIAVKTTAEAGVVHSKQNRYLTLATVERQ